MIAIIDYDAGNIKSVEKALNFLGQAGSRGLWRCHGKASPVRVGECDS